MSAVIVVALKYPLSFVLTYSSSTEPPSLVSISTCTVAPATGLPSSSTNVALNANGCPLITVTTYSSLATMNFVSIAVTMISAVSSASYTFTVTGSVPAFSGVYASMNSPSSSLVVVYSVPFMLIVTSVPDITGKRSSSYSTYTSPAM